MQLLLCSFTLGYVYNDHREKRRNAFTGRDKHRTDVRPHYAAIFAQVALLKTINSSAPFVRIRDTSFRGCTILFMADVSSRAPLEFRFSIAEHFLKSQVCRDEAAVWSDECNSGRRILSQHAPPLLTRTQRLFCFPAFVVFLD